MSEQGGRYNRSFEGLIGAMIAIVLLVLAFVVYRGLFSDPPVQELESVDYSEQVLGLQTNGIEVVYPASLPEGWRATELRYDPNTEQPRFELNLFTDDDEFIGLRQVDEEVDDLLVESGVDDADESDPLTGAAAGSVAEQWDGWSDEDGDHAFTTTVSTEVGEQTVLVYGSVPTEELVELVALLTTDPLATPAG